MRQFILILALSIFILSCKQNENKQKELEFKEKELALKEKELELKEKETKPNNSLLYPDSPSIAPTKESATTSGYNFDNHNDINIFIADLSKAVGAGDKNAVVQMTNFPFKDQLGNNPGNQTPSLGCKNADQFILKYDKIFVSSLVSTILSKKYRGWSKETAEEEPGPGEDIIEKGEYLIEGKPTGGRDYMIAIKKVQGKFKLYALKFYS